MIHRSAIAAIVILYGCPAVWFCMVVFIIASYLSRGVPLFRGRAIGSTDEFTTTI